MIQEDKFCSKCSGSLRVQCVEGKKRLVCPNCGYVIYYDPKLVVIVVVPREGQILMVRRAMEPGRLKWSLPGGFVDRGEVLEKAAEREVLEETGIEIRVTGMISLFSETDSPVVVAAYSSEILRGELTRGSEVLDLGFFSLDDLPLMAFPQNYKVLECWQEQGRSRDLFGQG